MRVVSVDALFQDIEAVDEEQDTASVPTGIHGRENSLSCAGRQDDDPLGAVLRVAKETQGLKSLVLQRGGLQGILCEQFRGSMTE